MFQQLTTEKILKLVTWMSWTKYKFISKIYLNTHMKTQQTPNPEAQLPLLLPPQKVLKLKKVFFVCCSLKYERSNFKKIELETINFLALSIWIWDLESLHLIQSLYFFFQKMTKKLQVVVWSSRCKFFWNALDPTLVIFFWKWKEIQVRDLISALIPYL